MTRDEILAKYKIDEHGVIRSPGKFEGEMLYAPYYWKLMLDGCGDDHYAGDEPITFFVIEEEDRATFPELGTIDGLSLYTSESGFVYIVEYDTKQDYEAAIAEIDTYEPIEEEG